MKLATFLSLRDRLDEIAGRFCRGHRAVHAYWPALRLVVEHDLELHDDSYVCAEDPTDLARGFSAELRAPRGVVVVVEDPYWSGFEDPEDTDGT